MLLIPFLRKQDGSPAFFLWEVPRIWALQFLYGKCLANSNKCNVYEFINISTWHDVSFSSPRLDIEFCQYSVYLTSLMSYTSLKLLCAHHMNERIYSSRYNISTSTLVRITIQTSNVHFFQAHPIYLSIFFLVDIHVITLLFCQGIFFVYLKEWDGRDNISILSVPGRKLDLMYKIRF